LFLRGWSLPYKALTDKALQGSDISEGNLFVTLSLIFGFFKGPPKIGNHVSDFSESRKNQPFEKPRRRFQVIRPKVISVFIKIHIYLLLFVPAKP
jgi:hypothetical protein